MLALPSQSRGPRQSSEPGESGPWPRRCSAEPRNSESSCFFFLTFWARATVPRKNRKPLQEAKSLVTALWMSTGSPLWGLEAAFPHPGVGWGDCQSLGSTRKLAPPPPPASQSRFLSLLSPSQFREATDLQKKVRKKSRHLKLVYPLMCRQVSCYMSESLKSGGSLPPTPPHQHLVR